MNYKQTYNGPSKVDYACLTLQWDMNWMRYTDATALMWQAIRSDIKTAIRTGK